MSSPDDYSFKQFLPAGGDRPVRHYFYKRKRAKRIVLTTRTADQLAGYTLIAHDLKCAMTWIKYAESLLPSNAKPSGLALRQSDDDCTADLIKGLFVATLSFYAKAFTKCEGRPVNMQRAMLDICFRELHDAVMDWRNHYAVHSGLPRLEEVVVALVMPHKRRECYPQIFLELRQPDFAWPASENVNLPLLISHAYDAAQAKAKACNEKLLAEVCQRGLDFWYS